MAFWSATLPGGAALARDPVVVATPFEVGPTQSGNYLAALIAGAERDTAAASTYFRETLRRDPNNPDLLERAFLAALANGDMAPAGRMSERLIKREPNNGLAHLTLGVQAIKTKQWATARGHVTRGADRVDITSVLLEAWTWAGAGDSKRALDRLDRLKDDRFKAYRDYHAGLIADMLKNPQEAGKRLKSAYDADSRNLRIVDAWARFSARNSDATEARRVYKAYDQLLPRHPVVVSAMADLDAGRPLDSTVRNAVAGAAEALYQLGSTGGQQNDDLAAMIYLRLGLFLAPENGLAAVTLADLYERIKQYERAIDIYEAIPAKSPLRANADVQVGLILDSLGRSDQALKHLSTIVAERPTDTEALIALGNLQRTRKDYVGATATYTKVLKQMEPLTRSAWTVLYFRGISYERQKNWDAAEADFKKALEIFPDQPLILNYLGYTWVDQGRNLDEAFTMLRKAVELRPTDGYIVDSLGWAYYKLGKYPEATKQLEQAVDLKPGDPTLNDHLGDIYWKVGRKLEAGFQWNHARDLNPEPDDLPRILEKIKSGLNDPAQPATAAGETKTGG